MANDQTSGEKTEPATPKRLRQARKQGDVAKSKDVTGTLGLAFSIVLIMFALTQGIDQLAQLTIDSLSVSDTAFDIRFRQFGYAAFGILLSISALILLPIALFGLLLEFLQTGPVFALEKLQPKLENLNPAAGLKKIFSLDNMIELLKNLWRVFVLALIGWLVISSTMGELMQLPVSDPMYIVIAVKTMVIRLLGWTLVVFLFITALDAAYQHHAYAKKMRMSVQDIKKEHKDNEGDPILKGQRRQLQMEWSQESANQASRAASVIVVNPTHIAIAIRYEQKSLPVPVITAKGKDEHARAMRQAANEAFVPVLRNEKLARQLLHDVEEGDPVPRELFDVIAQIILWARQTRNKLDPHLQWSGDTESEHDQAVTAPGEDLSLYPQRVNLFAHRTEQSD